MFAELAARRREFPALETAVHGKRLAYLDTAATCLLPRAVIAAVEQAAATLGSPGRGVHALAEAATIAVEDTRELVARTLRVEARELVFTSGTTASINLVADTWGRAHVGAGDVVIATELEHHANLLPWQRLCADRGARLAIAPVDPSGAIDLERFAALLDKRVKLVAVSHVSNVLGTVAPIVELARRAHAVGARVLVDGAQAVAHLDVDLGTLGCDFYAFSGHKVYGPSGTGVLWARAALLDEMPPWQLGGGIVSTVELQAARFREAPARFEAGTPNTLGIVGLGAALQFRTAQDRAAVAAGEHAVHRALVEAIEAAGGTILGRPELAVVAFTLGNHHPHDIATIADSEGVALRSGHHCAQPIHARFGCEASTRASVGCYSGLDDVAQLAGALARVRRVLG